MEKKPTINNTVGRDLSLYRAATKKPSSQSWQEMNFIRQVNIEAKWERERNANG